MTRRTLFLIGLLLGACLAMAGCQTINGLGRDIQGWTEPNVPKGEE